ncbi:MAG TPA: hypothetical protein DE315_06230 [Candidatus Omnitrophica bacterium]|nr:hypothetical protein [Candidatus Omnitrophota bacterium]HCI45107.1 hypothetical protein [Candidatus Omnitrophota bacterium]
MAKSAKKHSKNYPDAGTPPLHLGDGRRSGQGSVPRKRKGSGAAARSQSAELHYFNARARIYARLAQLPRGTVKERLISGRKYYYLQRREGKKVVHTYLGKEIPGDIKKDLEERESLRRELENIQKIIRPFVAAQIGKML